MNKTPHKEKLEAALRNPKCGEEDRALLSEAKTHYDLWIKDISELKSQGADKVKAMTMLLTRTSSKWS